LHACLGLLASPSVSSYTDQPKEVLVRDRTVAAAIKSQAPAMPVILLTGWGHRLRADGDLTCAYLAASERQGAHAVLAKPFEAWEIIAAIRQVLGH